MGVRNGRQRLSVDRADASALGPPDEVWQCSFHYPAILSRIS
jgi:hypothetical protein